MQKLVILTIVVALFAGAYSQSTCTGTPSAAGNSFANCASCSGTAVTDICTQCVAGYQLNKASGTVASCVAKTLCNSGFYPPISTATGATSANNVTCANTQPGTSGDVTGLPTKAQAEAQCAGPTTPAKTNTTMNYTASVIATTGAAYTSATPANTFQCIACTTQGCDSCNYNGTTGPALTVTGVSGCSKAATGYSLYGTADANGLSTGACSLDPTKYTGNNATTCTACSSTSNCTAGTCPTGFTYVTLATLPGTTVGGLNLTTLSTVAGPFQGCYNLTFLNATYGPKSASRASVAFAAVIAVVAAVFAF